MGKVKRETEEAGGDGISAQELGRAANGSCRALTIGQSWVPVMRQAEAKDNEKPASHRQDE